jgi:hypothetical protein
MVKRVSFMLYVVYPKFLKKGKKTKRLNQSNDMALLAPRKSRLCPSKAGMAPSSREKFKVRHCNTKITITETGIMNVKYKIEN